MLPRSLNFVFASSLLSLLAVLGGLVFAGAGTASADPLAGPGTIAIDAAPTVGGVNTSTSIGTIQNCVSIPVGGSATVEVVVDSIPVFTGLTGGIGGFGMNILYTSGVGAGALKIAAKAAPLVAMDGKSLLTNNGNSSNPSFTEAVPDVDGNFKIVDLDVANTYESGTGRLYYFTVTSAGTAGVGILDLTDINSVSTLGGGNYDLIPDLYASDTSVYTPASVLDAVVSVGSVCPPPVATSPSRQFCIDGLSTGMGWTWTVTGPPGSFYGSVANGTVAPGGTESQIANAWVLSMNTSFAGVLTASQLPGAQANCFRITPGNQTLIVNGCTVTTTGCSFNPTVTEVIPIGGMAELRVSDSGGQSVASAVALAFGVAALAIGLWYGRKRWSS